MFPSLTGEADKVVLMLTADRGGRQVFCASATLAAAQEVNGKLI